MMSPTIPEGNIRGRNSIAKRNGYGGQQLQEMLRNFPGMPNFRGVPP